MYSSTSARSALISIRLAPSRTMASRSKSRSDRSSSPTTMLNMGVPSMDGLSAALGLQQTGGYATLLSPNSIHNFGLYPTNVISPAMGRTAGGGLTPGGGQQSWGYPDPDHGVTPP